MSHSDCNYTIAPLSDSEPVDCGKTAIRRVVLADSEREMFYCFGHWNSVRDIAVIGKSEVEDLVEEEC